MTDIKKILIASICVVLAVAIAAGVSIGVLAGTVNGLKDTVAELQQANEAQEALNASMKAELDAAKANGENIVTAEEFEAKLAAALGEQNQTMQALISTAVKNQIEDLETEGLTEAQVQEIIDAAVANCLTEADIDAIVAGVDSGLTKDEVKKIVADYTVGTLTYGQIVDLIDDADYDLRVYLEKQIKAVADAVKDLGGEIADLEGTVAGRVNKLTIDAATVEGTAYALNHNDLVEFLDGGKIVLKGDWSNIDFTLTYNDEKEFVIDVTDVTLKSLTINAPKCHVEVIGNGNSVIGTVTATVASNTLVLKGVTVVTKAEIKKGRIVTEDVTVEGILTVGGGAAVEIDKDSTVGQITVFSSSNGSTIVNNGMVSKIVVAGTNTNITNNGEVTGEVRLNGEGTTVTNNANIEEVTVNVAGTTINNTENAEIGSVTVEQDVAEDVVIENKNTSAEIEEVGKATTAEGLAKAVAAGGSVVLGADIDLDTAIVVDTVVALDLNGYTLTVTKDTVGDGVFCVVKGGELTIDGEGTINGVGINDYNMVIWAKGGNVIINGGTYTNVGAGEDDHYDVIYASEDGKVTINGGTFIGQTPKWTLNLKDSLPGVIVVKGGTFHGYNPSESASENPVANFVAEGYDVVESDDVCTVVFGVAVKNTEELKAANVKNATIYLAAGSYECPKLAEGVTIIGVGDVVFTNTLTGTMKNITIKNVKVKAGNAQRWAYASGNLVFENCTFEATSVYAIHYDGTTNANILYKDCTIIGWVAIAGGQESLVFDGCEIYGNGTYGVIRVYDDTTIINCTFDVDNVNKTDVYQDGIHAVDCTIIVENCTNVNGEIEDILNVSGTGVIKVK